MWLGLDMLLNFLPRVLNPYEEHLNLPFLIFPLPSRDARYTYAFSLLVPGLERWGEAAPPEGNISRLVPCRRGQRQSQIIVVTWEKKVRMIGKCQGKT